MFPGKTEGPHQQTLGKIIDILAGPFGDPMIYYFKGVIKCQ